MREHREQGRNEERVMWSHEGRKMSMYSKVNIDAQEEPSEGKCEMKRDSTPRCLGRGDNRTEGGKHAAREGRNPTCDQSDRESIRGTSLADEGRVSGSAIMLFGRATTTDWGRRCECRIWRMEPMVREHVAGTVVRVGRMGMLEMEDEAEQSQAGREGPRLLTIAEISHLLLS